jgi:hypothetical protein
VALMLRSLLRMALDLAAGLILNSNRKLSYLKMGEL